MVLQKKTKHQILRSPSKSFLVFPHFQAFIRIRDLRYLELINSIEVRPIFQQEKKNPSILCKAKFTFFVC